MASLLLGTMEAILRWTGQMTDIDRRRCERVVPMKVLVLGLSRTGTSCESRFIPSPISEESALGELEDVQERRVGSAKNHLLLTPLLCTYMYLITLSLHVILPPPFNTRNTKR